MLKNIPKKYFLSVLVLHTIQFVCPPSASAQLYMFPPKVICKKGKQVMTEFFLDCFQYLTLLASRHLRTNSDYKGTLTEILIFLY